LVLLLLCGLRRARGRRAGEVRPACAETACAGSEDAGFLSGRGERLMHPLAHKKITIIGLGLIGGSLARALAAADIDCEITGVGREGLILEQAISDGSITAFTTDVQTACADADLVVIAVPVLAIAGIFRE